MNLPSVAASFEDMKMTREKKRSIHDEKVASLEAKWLSEDSQI